MITFTASTLQEAYIAIEATMKSGQSLTQIANAFTLHQLAHFIDEYVSNLKTTAEVERSISKSLCCFLFELLKNGDSHYADIRATVLEKYGHMTNDYSTLQFWRLIEKSNRGLGYWKITDRGIKFLNGELELSERLTIRNKKIVFASPNLITIRNFPDFISVAYNPNNSHNKNEAI